MLAIGEVHTGLLQNSTSLSKADSAQLLDLVLGERVRESERPIDHVASAARYVGVDCRLPTASGAHVRGIGTVAVRSAMTGGHVLQGSAHLRVANGPGSHRLPWSHYLANPGVVETIGRAEPVDLVDGFVGGFVAGGGGGGGAGGAGDGGKAIDLGALCARSMDEVQRSTTLDRRTALKTARTRLRWAIVAPDPAGPPARAGVVFAIEAPTLRTLRVVTGPDALEAAVAWCEDLALHDWLLTTLLMLIDRNLTWGAVRSRRVERLRPAIEHLLHLWMPAARTHADVLPLWESMDRRVGFTRQWQACVGRIRDQVTMNAITLLGTSGPQGGAET